MILLPKQTVTDITSISFYELVLNEYSVSNRIKTWINLELRNGHKQKNRFMSLYINSSRRKHYRTPSNTITHAMVY